jgi:hypothetical protein
MALVRSLYIQSRDQTRHFPRIRPTPQSRHHNPKEPPALSPVTPLGIDTHLPFHALSTEPYLQRRRNNTISPRVSLGCGAAHIHIDSTPTDARCIDREVCTSFHAAASTCLLHHS